MRYREVPLAGLASRIVVVVLGCLLAHDHWVPLVGSQAPKPTWARVQDDLGRGSRRLIAPWYSWDGQWYARISLEGYTEVRGEPYSTLGFMPLLPMLMSGAAWVGLDRYWFALILCNLCFVVGLYLFARLAYLVTADAGTTWRSCALLMAYPWSFYFSAPYQESLGFALSAAAVLAWLTSRPAACAISSALATAARFSQLSVPMAIVGEWVHAKLRRRPAPPWAWPVAIVGSLGTIAFFTYLYFEVGDAQAYLRGHRLWGRQPPSVPNLIRVLLSPPHTLDALKDYLAGVLFIGLGFYGWWRRGLFWGLIILLPALQPLATGTLLSEARLALMAFPAMIEAGVLTRRRFLFWPILIACIPLQVILIKNHIQIP